jgi:hypothetical protein
VRTKSKIHCASCRKRISRSEPDYVFVDHAKDKRRYYHTRCAPAMGELVEPSGVYSVFYRDVNPEAN